MDKPKVSIVIPSFNQARYLPLTLQCLREQDYPNIEQIVVDGGSTDGTLDILRSTPGIQWVSERDRGQVDALNKGFKMCQGEILAWLNSDDTMDRNAVSRAATALQGKGADLVYGDLEIVDERGKFLRMSRGIPFDLRTLLYGINYIGQQTVFFRRALLERAGPLREEFDNGFDYELWLRMAQHGKLAYVPGLRAQIRVHSEAKSVARRSVTVTDRGKIVAEYWATGGFPAIFQLRPWIDFLNLGYRLKRQLWIRLSARGGTRPA